MTLFDRTRQILRAKASSWQVAKIDPERELEETLGAMQNELLLLRQAIASAIALQKGNERQRSQQETVAESLQHRAKAALLRGDEPSARAFLLQRHTCLKSARALQEQIGQQHEIIQRMRANSSALEQKLNEALTRQQMYVARARSAEVTRRLYEFESASDSVRFLQ